MSSPGGAQWGKIGVVATSDDMMEYTKIGMLMAFIKHPTLLVTHKKTTGDENNFRKFCNLHVLDDEIGTSTRVFENAKMGFVSLGIWVPEPRKAPKNLA